MWRPAFATACLIMALSSPAMADARTNAALQLSQGAIGSKVPDLEFQEANGKTVAIADLRGKPVLVTLIYTSCSDVCPTIIESLAPAVGVAEDTLGKGSFNVLTIGFDTRNDTPERMRSFARAHRAGLDNWLFVGSDQATMDRLSIAVGFSYSSSAGGFDHMAQVTVLDKSGTVYQQVYGSTFEPPAIVEPLKQLILGGERSMFSLAGLGDRVRLFCTVYDRKSGRYIFDYSLFVSIIVGAVCLIGILAFLLREARKSFRGGSA
jgi:protein SCO1/2